MHPAEQKHREEWLRLTGRTLEEEAAIHEEAARLAEEMGVPIWTGITIAQDRASKKRARQHLDRGDPWKRALAQVGSFAFMECLIEWIEEGLVPQEEVYEDLPDYWRGSDPDDTDPRFFQLWLDAWEANGFRTITDGKPLPTGRIRIFRGQDEDAAPGISWTFDEDIAQKFAHGAATRQRNRNGIIYKATIRRDKVIAYLTGRSESEVIVNPMWLR